MDLITSGSTELDYILLTILALIISFIVLLSEKHNKKNNLHPLNGLHGFLTVFGLCIIWSLINNIENIITVFNQIEAGLPTKYRVNSELSSAEIYDAKYLLAQYEIVSNFVLFLFSSLIFYSFLKKKPIFVNLMILRMMVFAIDLITMIKLEKRIRIPDAFDGLIIIAPIVFAVSVIIYLLKSERVAINFGKSDTSKFNHLSSRLKI